MPGAARPDGHQWNVLLPREIGGRVYLMDWHQYRRWWRPKDVAVLVVRTRAPEHRAAGGYHLLRYYYEQLLQYGVTGYSWNACRDDYRLGVIEYLHFLLWFRNAGTILLYVEAMMELLHDVGGAELLG